MSDETESKTSFDDLIEKLQTVVAKLESGNLSLEESLQAYEDGVTLARRGHELLDGAEKRVELLVRDSAGELSAEPFDPASEPTQDSTREP